MVPPVLILVKNLTSGGAEKQSVLLAKALEDSCDVHYAILNARYQEPKYLQLLKEGSSVKVVAFQGSLPARFRKFCKYLKQHQIRHVFSYLTAANFYAVSAGKISGVQNIYTGIRNAYLPPAKAFIDRFLCNRVATKAVLNCYSGEKYFAEKGFNRHKMTVIPNCFENIAAPKVKYKTDDRVRIISVGRFVEQKDYATALLCVDRLRKKYPGIIYQIVGYGELEAVIRSKVKELGLDNFVEIYINPGNIPDLLDRADIYLSTSVFEGTSNSIMEAMNADLPIVATDVGDNYKLVIKEKNGYLAAIKDVDEIVAALEKLITGENRTEMGQYSKTHLQEQYSVQKFRDTYQQLIKEHL
ncbi:MAG: glycosyltransferase [Niabella sp.]